MHIRLIEAKERVVPEMSPAVSRLTAEKLRGRQLQLLLNSPVVGMEGERLRTRDGALLAPGTNIWTAGIRANEIAGLLPAEHGSLGRVVVNDFLQLPGHPEVFVIGDNALANDPQSGKPTPPTAPAAIQMGECVAANIERSLRGMPPQAFRYQYRGELLTLGRNQAIAHVGSLLFNGFPGW